MDTCRRISALLLILIATTCVYSDTEIIWKKIADDFDTTLNRMPDKIQTVAIYRVRVGENVNAATVRGFLEKKLVRNTRFGLIDRQTIEEVLKEQQLSMTGAVSNRDMVKAGKLIGVQGFFIVNAKIKKDKAVCSIKAINVETGAVIYSETFTRHIEKRNRLGISLGIAFFPEASFPDGLEIYNEIDGHGISEHTDAVLFNGPVDNAPGTGLCAGVSYINNARLIKNISFGFDIKTLIFFEAVSAPRTNIDTVVAETNGMDTTFQAEYNGDTEFDATRGSYLCFRPKISYRLSDMIKPYLSVSLRVGGVQYRCGGWYNVNFNKRHDEANSLHVDSDDHGTVVTGSVAPVAGMDFFITRALSVFAEVHYLMETRTEVDTWAGDKDDDTEHGWRFKFTSQRESGVALIAGITAYPFAW